MKNRQKKSHYLFFVAVLILSLSMLNWGCSSGGSGGGSDYPVPSPSPTITTSPTPTPSESPSPSPTPTDIYTIDDFIPPSGAASDPPPGGGVGPWSNRVMIAVSNDSLNFTRTNTIISDQADVPNAVRDTAGRIFVYYVGWNPPEVKNKIVCAVSVDDGSTWHYKIVNMLGVPEGWNVDFVDPTAVLLPDGRIRLYATSQAPDAERPGPYSAISNDGLNFTLESQNQIVQDTNLVLLDPCVYLIGDIWHLYNGPYNMQGGGNPHFTSSNGTEFDFAGFAGIEGQMLMSNIIQVSNDTYRVYGFPSSPDVDPYIESAITTDGYTWTKDSGRRLEFNTSAGLESSFVKDPGIVTNNSGTYLMFYVTKIPD